MKNNITKLILLFVALLTFLSVSMNVNAEENVTKQEKLIFIDTNGSIGNLKYLEEYYTVNSDGKLVLDKRLLFFNGKITDPKVKFKIRRPLKNGQPYPENRIKAIATINNKTIINSWYKAEDTEKSTNANTNANTPTEKSPGFGLLLSGIAIMFLYYQKKR